MPEQLKRLLAWFRKQSLTARIVMVGGLVVLLVGLATVAAVSLGTSYAPLYYNLEREDAAEVVDYLKKAKIPYRLTDQGRVIEVPRERLYEVRLDLAGNALPGGGVGFEIFDKTNLGVTEFVQNINYQRALQGELARTIREIRQVESARVHLVLPKKSLFIEDQQEATASVILKLKPGRRLNREQVEGVMKLVAGSVEGLRPEQVTVLDSRGMILSREVLRPENNDSLTSKQLEFKREYERNVEKSLRSMLERVVGVGKVVVRVAAAMDFSKVEKTEELYDPDMVAVRSEHLLATREPGTAGPARGVPGVAANVPGQGMAAKTAAGSAAGSTVSRDDQTKNYEISKTVSHTILPVGSLKNISVAVLVDGRYQENAQTKKVEFVPRSADEIQVYDRMVKKAVGFNKKRGDQVEVACMAFDTASMAAELREMKQAQRWELLKTAGKYLLLALVVLLLYLKLLKPLLSYFRQLLQAAAPAPGPQAAGAGGVGRMAEEVKEEVTIRKERTMMDKIVDYARENPDEVARIIKIWLKEQTS